MPLTLLDALPHSHASAASQPPVLNACLGAEPALLWRQDFKADPTIYLAHMGCLADSDAADAESADLDITFLYKLTDGACPQRYAATFTSFPS